MGDDRLEKSSVVEFVGLALGILIGGPIGPIVFTPAGLGVPAAATVGSFVGAILGYAASWGLVSIERRRRDRELQRAADAVRTEAGIPRSVTIRVKDARRAKSQITSSGRTQKGLCLLYPVSRESRTRCCCGRRPAR